MRNVVGSEDQKWAQGNPNIWTRYEKREYKLKSSKEHEMNSRKKEFMGKHQKDNPG